MNTLQPEFDDSKSRRLREHLAQEPTDGFDEKPTARASEPRVVQPGQILDGRYKLLENIGEGGMGSVWVADQLKPVKRRVAIKLIKASWIPNKSWLASKPNAKLWP